MHEFWFHNENRNNKSRFHFPFETINCDLHNVFKTLSLKLSRKFKFGNIMISNLRKTESVSRSLTRMLL